MNNVYIDFSLLAHRTLFTMRHSIKQFGYDILRHVMIRSIISEARKFKADRVYVCFDVGKSWRKEYSSLYKAQRKESREKQSVSSGGDVDWEEFYRIINEMFVELKENFPFYVFGIHKLEADDIIAYLVRTADPDDNKIMITSDRDYVQLLQYPNTKLWDPVQKKYIKSNNPFHDLQVKIMIGDKSDNIPAIRPRCGQKTAEKMIDSGEIDLLLQERKSDGKTPTELVENYWRNEKLIDLSKAPKTLVRLIEEEVDNYELGNSKGLLKYFVNKKLNQLMGDIDNIRKVLARLT
jgi:5'-3' exonuclease